MRGWRQLAGLLLVLGTAQSALLAAVETIPAAPAKPAEIKYYPAGADGRAVLYAALTDAKAHDKLAVIVFGADWCHDSRALAQVLRSFAFKFEFGHRYTVAFIDVGVPQTGHGTNLDLVKLLGVKDLKSTPALFVISAQGKVLNSRKDAVSWRNAESRGPDKVLAWFRGFDKH